MLLRIIKKFGKMFGRRERLQVIRLVILMIIGALFELLNVAMIFLFMNSVMDPEAAIQSGLPSKICRILGITSPQTFLIILAIVMAVVYLLKDAFLIFQYNMQFRFVYGKMLSVQKLLLKDILCRPYEFFLNTKTAELIRIVTDDVTYTFYLLVSLLQLFTELVVSVVLVLYLFLTSPLVSLAIFGFLCLILLVVVYIVKPILARSGSVFLESTSQSNRWLSQSIQGIKEIKVAQKEAFFQKNYNRHSEKRIVAMRHNQVLSTVPKFMIEAFSMCSVFIMMAVLIGFGNDLVALIPTLTVILMAAVRLLPSINRISASMSQIAFNEPMLDKTVENLSGVKVTDGGEYLIKPEKTGKVHFPMQESIRLSCVTFHYTKSRENILEAADMEIGKGMSIGIVGPSGALRYRSTILSRSPYLLLPECFPWKQQIWRSGKECRSVS